MSVTPCTFGALAFRCTDTRSGRSGAWPARLRGTLHLLREDEPRPGTCSNADEAASLRPSFLAGVRGEAGKAGGLEQPRPPKVSRIPCTFRLLDRKTPFRTDSAPRSLTLNVAGAILTSEDSRPFDRR